MKNILILFLTGLQLFAFGQRKKGKDTSNLFIQPNRFEYGIGKYDGDFTIINGGYDGLMVVTETVAKNNGNFLWHITKLDTALALEWKTSLEVNTVTQLIGYEYFGGKFYVLASTSQFRPQDLKVFEFDQEGNIEDFDISTVFPIGLAYFEVVGKTLILGGNVNGKPVIVTYDLEERKPRVLPGFYEDRNEIMDVFIDDEEQLFTVILRERLITKQLGIRAKTFTSEGLLVQDVVLNSEDKRNLVDGASSSFAHGIQLIAGTHSKKNTAFSKGLYLSKFINGRQQFIEFYDYADLENFFGYHNTKREERIKRRIEKRRQLGKKKQFNYRLLVHDIIETDNANIMVAEAYYPRYSNNGYYAGAFGAPNFARPITNFLGYKYTHAIVVAFDNQGKILWDHSFKIKGKLSYSLDKFVSVSSFQNKIVLMYLDENEIRSKVVEGDKVVEGHTFNPVKLSSTADEVRGRDPDFEGLDQWYDRCFYAYGIHDVYRESKSGNTSYSRQVFYINKIQYDDATNVIN